MSPFFVSPFFEFLFPRFFNSLLNDVVVSSYLSISVGMCKRCPRKEIIYGLDVN